MAAKKGTEVLIGTMLVKQYFDQESNSWLTMVCDEQGTSVGEVEYCDYGDKESRRRQLNSCKKKARDMQGISGWRGGNNSED